jgi:tRNA-specific 2-thiouridylase
MAEPFRAECDLCNGEIAENAANPCHAIALLSGGLDSSLAVKMMIDQGIAITAVHFTSPFCNCTSRKAGCKQQAVKVAHEFGVPIRVIHKGMDYMRMVQSPPHGHGRGMNPCIDCRIYMLKKVKEIMAGSGASFIVTGEVLGQRPMSQHRAAIRKIEKESGLEGFILRPLSAQHFPPTIPEQEGIVDRQKLLSFSGRSRKPQIHLAERLGVKDYPCPAGGCLLTEKVIASRLRDLFAHQPNYDMLDLSLLTIGRHFRLNPGLKIIVGRNQVENERIQILAQPSSVLFCPVGFRGPTALARGILGPPAEQMVGEIIARHSQEEKNEYFIQKQIVAGMELIFAVEKKFPKEILDTLRMG